MEDKKKKSLFIGIVAIALCILIAAGSTFEYFNAAINSEEGAIETTAAEVQRG